MLYVMRQKVQQMGEEEGQMEPKDYLVIRIEGDYGILCECTDGDGETFPVAMALLPEGVEEGSRVHCECLEYSLL